MTRDVFPILEKVYDITVVRPVVAFETADGGASEMDTLNVLNKLNKYSLFKMPAIGKDDPPDATTFGYITSGGTRPILVSDLKDAIDAHAFAIYDKPTIGEFHSFIINKQGKPEAEVGAHDDLVMSVAIAWQLYQTCSNNTFNPASPGPFAAYVSKAKTTINHDPTIGV